MASLCYLEYTGTQLASETLMALLQHCICTEDLSGDPESSQQSQPVAWPLRQKRGK